MPASIARQSKRLTPPTWLTEHVSSAGSSLTVDETACVIKGVRIAGRYSPNCHGIPGVTGGTEYTEACHQSSARLYEGVPVYCNHPSSRSEANKSRQVHEGFGVLRNVRAVKESNGDTVTRGDLHYNPAHDMAARVVEDVRRGLGLYGLSHNARPEKPKVINGKYVIERLAEVRSVDLVDRPATNKNLWESHTVTTTFRDLLESRLPSLSKKRKVWANHLLEMDDLPAMDAPVEDAGGGDPDEALLSGFRAAVMAIFDSEGDARTKAKKIKDYLIAHESLTGDKEPTDEPEEDEETESDDVPKMESLQAERDCLKLCLLEGFKPSEVMLEAMLTLPTEAKRRAFISESRGTTSTTTTAASKPRSAAAPRPRSTPENVTESTDAPKDASRWVKG